MSEVSLEKLTDQLLVEYFIHSKFSGRIGNCTSRGTENLAGYISPDLLSPSGNSSKIDPCYFFCPSEEIYLYFIVQGLNLYHLLCLTPPLLSKITIKIGVFLLCIGNKSKIKFLSIKTSAKNKQTNRISNLILMQISGFIQKMI